MRVFFFAIRSLHFPHMLPVYHWIKWNHPEVDACFVVPHFIPTSPNQPGFGIENSVKDALTKQGVKINEIDYFSKVRPDVVVMADADFSSGIDKLGVKLVNINHGLIGKGCFYSDNAITRRENVLDMICVPGPLHREMLKRTVSRPITVTGLVKFDAIVNKLITRENVLSSLNIDLNKKVILFAPTFNPELSAVPIVAGSLRGWVSRGTHVLIKLHDMCSPVWKEFYQLLAEENDGITYINSLDITSALVAADAMVSDVSSVLMEFAALDKPLVLVDNPKRIQYRYFDPRDIEYQWRKIGYTADNAKDIQRSVFRALEFPNEYSIHRKRVAERVAGPMDGMAAKRVSDAIFSTVN